LIIIFTSQLRGILIVGKYAGNRKNLSMGQIKAANKKGSGKSPAAMGRNSK